MALKCIVITPEQQLLSQEIMQAIIPAHDGLMGILSGRAPMMVKLGIGPLRIDFLDGTKKHYFVDGGLAQMKHDTLTILTPSATAASEIDAQKAAAEYAAALAIKAATPKDQEERDKAMQRARAKQAIAGK
jgi:F-type H+-transporting ATPase subunit epsilon